MPQVVICSNRCTTDEKVEEILAHELVHMYDHCTGKVDFEDVRHLACSEIRQGFMRFYMCKAGRTGLFSLFSL